MPVISTALESKTAIMYEKGVMILSDLLDLDYLDQAQAVQLNAQIKAVRSLTPKKQIEEVTYTQARHIAALNILCIMDKWKVDWENEASEALSSVHGVEALVAFLEQNAHETYKSQAAQVIGMVAENGSINSLLFEASVVDILVEGLTHSSIEVKRNVSESLAFLLKDLDVRTQVSDDRIVNQLLTEYRSAKDQIYLENLLLSLMHLSTEKRYKVPLYEALIVDSLLHNITASKSDPEAIYAIRTLMNIAHNSDIRWKTYDKVAIPISNLLQNKPVTVISQLLLLL